MPTNARALRRQRILESSKDRLAFITGHVQNLPSTSSQSLCPNNPKASNVTAPSPPLISQIRYPNSRLSCHPTAHKPTDEAVEPTQNDGFGGGRRREIGTEVHRKPPSVSGPEQLLAILLNPFRSVTLQQLSFVIEATERNRTAFSITMALLVLMSYSGFPIFGSKIIRGIILFQPLLLLLFSNAAIIVLRLLSDVKRGEKCGNKLTVLGGYGWAEEAVRALEVGLMLHDVLQTLFMDFIVYSLIIVCGFCLFR